MVEKHKLSAREKIDYVPAFLSIGGTAVVAPFTGLVRGSDGADTYKHHIAHTIIRKPTFEHYYLKWCKSKGKTPDFVETDSFKGFWMGDKEKAKYTIVYFHGGGFALDGSEGHINFWDDVQRHVARNGVNTAFFFVVYTLTPHALYPTQLRESVAAVQYLVEVDRRSPSSLILAGDSAGGNLAVAILLHMSEPCPEIENNFTIQENFKALILMAPWVSFDTDLPSFSVNKHKDYIEADVEGRWSAEYIGVTPKPRARVREITTGNPDTHANSIYAEPALASAEAWTNAKCDNMLIVHGSREALADGIQQWVEKYKKGIGKERVEEGAIDVCVGHNEVHIAPIIWPLFGDSKETESGVTIKKWMLEKLS